MLHIHTHTVGISFSSVQTQSRFDFLRAKKISPSRDSTLKLFLAEFSASPRYFANAMYERRTRIISNNTLPRSVFFP